MFLERTTQIETCVCKDTNAMQLSRSSSHQTLQPKRTHDIQPIGGRLATPLSRATATKDSHRHSTVIINVDMITRLSQLIRCRPRNGSSNNYL